MIGGEKAGCPGRAAAIRPPGALQMDVVLPQQRRGLAPETLGEAAAEELSAPLEKASAAGASAGVGSAGQQPRAAPAKRHRHHPSPPPPPPPLDNSSRTGTVAFLPDLGPLLSSAQPGVSAGPQSADFTLNPAFLSRAVLNFGRLQNPETLRRLQSGVCLEILAIGGSVTCGSSDAGPDNPDRPRGAQDAWPAQLEELLSAYPCADARTGLPGRHHVENRCSRGVGTDYWVESIANLPLRPPDPKRAWDEQLPTGDADADAAAAAAAPGKYARDLAPDRPRAPDIVLVDTALNDLSGLRQATAHHQAYWSLGSIIARYTETLVMLLRELRGSPSVVYVGTCTHAHGFLSVAEHGGGEGEGVAGRPGFSEDGAAPRVGDAAAEHAAVTRHHDVPHVSVVDGLAGPAPSPAAVEWIARRFKADSHHPTRLGHRIVAAAVLHLLHQHNASARWPRAPGLPHGDDVSFAYRPRPPRFVPRSWVDMYLRSNAYKANTARPGASFYREPLAQSSAAGGWNVFEDVPGKPGLIANRTGESVAYLLDSGEAAGSVRFGAVHVLLLKSYRRGLWSELSMVS